MKDFPELMYLAAIVRNLCRSTEGPGGSMRVFYNSKRKCGSEDTL